MIEVEIQAPDPLDEEICIVAHLFAQMCYNAGMGCAQNIHGKLVYPRFVLDVKYRLNTYLPLDTAMRDVNIAIAVLWGRQVGADKF